MNQPDQKKNKAKKNPLVIFNILFLMLICLAIFSLYKIFYQASVPKLNPVEKTEMGTDLESSFVYANGRDLVTQPAEESKPGEGTRLQGFTVVNEVRTKEYMEKAISQFGPGDSEESEDEIIPDSDVRLITADDVEEAKVQFRGLVPSSSNVPQMIINEILARHGYRFKNKDILDYFLAKDWYRDRDDYEKDMDKVMTRLSETEKKNIDFIVKNYR